jgi:hypothetical protein
MQPALSEKQAGFVNLLRAETLKRAEQAKNRVTDRTDSCVFPSGHRQDRKITISSIVLLS